MCIIFSSENQDSRPTLDELELAEKTNPHGAGIAWVEDNKVHFIKNLDLTAEDIDKVAKTKLGPMVIHFRITSSGETTSSLNHPYPVETEDLNRLKGTAGTIFAHNGTVDNYIWQRLLIDTDMGILPSGPWSDTKALAYCMAFYNSKNILDVFESDNRFITLNSKGILDRWGSWEFMRKGLWSSNKLGGYKFIYSGGYTYSKEDDKVISLPTCATKYDLPSYLEQQQMEDYGKFLSETVYAEDDIPVESAWWTDKDWEQWAKENKSTLLKDLKSTYSDKKGWPV